MPLYKADCTAASRGTLLRLTTVLLAVGRVKGDAVPSADDETYTLPGFTV
jgi:hypothetical protein